MVLALATELVEGETVAVSLGFEKAGKLTVSRPVKGAGAMM